MATEDHVRDILSAVLKLDLGIDSHPLRADTPSWDSLKHVELILTLESEFGIRLTEEEMAQVVGLDSIVALVDGHLAA